MDISQVEYVLSSLLSLKQEAMQSASDASRVPRFSLLLQGPPGTGKTSVARDIPKKLGLPVITLSLPTCEAVDLRGLMYREGERTRWASPFPRRGEGVLILDELASAPADVQTAAHHLVWSEEGSDSSLPPGWTVILTSNKAKHRAHVRPMTSAMRSRLIMLDMEVSYESWVKWGMSHGIHPLVVGFIRWRPNLLVTEEPPAEGSFPSPRGWEQVSHLMPLSFNPDVELALLTGVVGAGAASEFAEYVRAARSLPQVDLIRKNPKKAPVPKKLDELYALTTVLSYITRDTKESFMAYVRRLPADFGMLYLRDVRNYCDFRDDPDALLFLAEHEKSFDF